MSQITKLNLDDFIQNQFKNNTEMVVRLNDGSIIFVDEQALGQHEHLFVAAPLGYAPRYSGQWRLL